MDQKTSPWRVAAPEAKGALRRKARTNEDAEAAIIALLVDAGWRCLDRGLAFTRDDAERCDLWIHYDLIKAMDRDALRALKAARAGGPVGPPPLVRPKNKIAPECEGSFAAVSEQWGCGS
jgi:hypothetical protein